MIFLYVIFMGCMAMSVSASEHSSAGAEISRQHDEAVSLVGHTQQHTDESSTSTTHNARKTYVKIYYIRWILHPDAYGHTYATPVFIENIAGHTH